MSFLKFTVLRKGEVSTLKVPFTSSLKLFKDKKKNGIIKEKTPKLWRYSQWNICFSTKPIKIDDFDEAEEKEVKEHVRKRKRKRGEITEKNEFFLKKEKTRRKLKKKTERNVE